VIVRVCVDCGEEYRPEVARCVDCGGVLEDRHDDDGTSAPLALEAPADSDQPFPGGRPLAVSAHARELVPLADRLLEAGLKFRISSRDALGDERPRGFELLVKDLDRSAATLAVADLVGPESGVTLLEVRARVDAAAAEDTETELRCPACDTLVAASATECPDCGLGLEGEREP
jgi:hypothetical protein